MVARFIEPRLHDSNGKSGCSPQGFVDSIEPTWGVGLEALTRSMKTMPGSPLFQAWSTISLKRSLALSVPETVRVRGF